MNIVAPTMRVIVKSALGSEESSPAESMTLAVAMAIALVNVLIMRIVPVVSAAVSVVTMPE